MPAGTRWCQTVASTVIQHFLGWVVVCCPVHACDALSSFAVDDGICGLLLSFSSVACLGLDCPRSAV